MSKIKESFKQNIVSIPTLKRLPSYLNYIEQVVAEGVKIISATSIAEELELEPIQVRKDLASTGIVGKPRVGYKTGELLKTIKTFLNWDRDHKALIVGMGNLGSALMNYRDLRRHGLKIVGAVDTSPSKQGEEVRPLEELRDLIAKTGATMVLLTVPREEAQKVADILSETPIQAIWNFTNVKLRLPERILLIMEDLSSGFAVLSFHLSHYKSRG